MAHYTKLPKHYTKLTGTVGTLVAEVGSAMVFTGSAAADEVGGVSPAMVVGGVRVGVGVGLEVFSALSCATAWSGRQDTLLIRY